MKYEVTKVFRDKPTNKRCEVGSIYETDDEERAEFLQSKGHIGEDDIAEAIAAAEEAAKKVEEEAKKKDETEGKRKEEEQAKKDIEDKKKPEATVKTKK